MKLLTITQPWATLIAIGAKRIETRPKRANYEGDIAIHAAKHLNGIFPGADDLDLADLCARPGRIGEELARHGLTSDVLPRGHVVAVARLVRAHMSATVQKLRGLLPGPPVALAVTEVVVAECGCQVFIGYRMDNNEPAAGTSSCDTYGHDYAMGNFNESLRISLVADPQERPLSEVCVEMLDQALDGIGARA